MVTSDKGMKDRRPAVAGQFYAADPETLRRTVQSYFQKPQSPVVAMAVVVPHAGYMYSGSVAGKVFSSVRVPPRVILLGPNHSGRGAELALAPAGAWQMPLGSVPVDADLNANLLSACPELEEDASAHQREHAIEVQIPFLQVLQPDIRFSAICIRTPKLSALEDLGHAMARVITARVINAMKEPVLMVASSDMTHYQSADDAARQDKLAIDRMLALDPQGLYRTVLQNDISMCGFAPAVAVLVACRDLGASAGRLIQYTNSGEASGDFHRVVAYAGITIS
jgi:MEMO1 family protein